MPIDAKTAEEICDRIAKASALCETSLRVVKTNEGLGHVQVFGRLVGTFMGHSYTNVLAPLWKQFPALEPEEMRIPYVEPEVTLTPESQRALEEFVHEANAALEYVRSLADPNDIEKSFSYGGLPELEQAVLAIEEFLKHPRFRDPEDQA